MSCPVSAKYDHTDRRDKEWLSYKILIITILNFDVHKIWNSDLLEKHFMAWTAHSSAAVVPFQWTTNCRRVNQCLTTRRHDCRDNKLSLNHNDNNKSTTEIRVSAVCGIILIGKLILKRLSPFYTILTVFWW